MKKSRVLSAALAAAMVFTAIPAVHASAEEKTKIVFSCYLATDEQVAVRHKYIGCHLRM